MTTFSPLPPPPSFTSTNTSAAPTSDQVPNPHEQKADSRTRPLRLKRKRAVPSSADSTNATSVNPSRHRHHHHRHHRSKRHHHDDSFRQGDPDPDPFNRPLSPNAAFRESLFDAMADDEGAAFWEGVYGQPVHIYSSHYKSKRHEGKGTTAADNVDEYEGSDDPNSGTASPRGKNNPGEKETEEDIQGMTDEEYADFVRRRMWEKSHEFIFAEREKRAEERRQKRERERRGFEEGIRQADRQRERMWWDKGTTSTSTRTKEKKVEKERTKWRKIWDRYVEYWQPTTQEVAATGEEGERRHTNDENNENVKGGTMRGCSPEQTNANAQTKTSPITNPKPPTRRMIYPVENGQWSSVNQKEVSHFFTCIAETLIHSHPTITLPPPPPPPPPPSDADDLKIKTLRELLKRERIRWHPDKIQQRAGSSEGGRLSLEEGVMERVTAIFQIIDRLWEEGRR